VTSSNLFLMLMMRGCISFLKHVTVSDFLSQRHNNLQSLKLCHIIGRSLAKVLTEHAVLVVSGLKLASRPGIIIVLDLRSCGGSTIWVCR